MELYIISSLASVFAAATAVATYKFLGAKHKFEEIKIQYAMCSNKEITLQSEVIAAQHENIKLRDRAVEAETHLVNLQAQFAKLDAEKRDAISAREQAKEEFHKAQQEIVQVNERIAQNEKRINDWEAQREQAFKDAREALFITGKEVFNKEAEEINKKALLESAEISKKTKEHFDAIIQKVNVLSSQQDSTSKDINLVMKSMSSPAAVGQFSEVGLASILKGYGLAEGQDFIIQYSVGSGDGAKRPDAVLFIRDNVFVIDSKASKFFLELAEAEGTPRERVVMENIKKSMNLHLNSLASKGYIEAVKEDIQKNRSDFEIGHMQMVMFLCNESHVNKIAHGDPEFIPKAIAKDIVISGPTGLQGLLAFARYSIARQKRDKNRELLIDEIRNLLGSISTVVGHAVKVGSGIKSAAGHYEKLVASINSNLLSKADKITKLGMPLPGNKKLPGKLESFEVTSHSQHLIEAEAVNDDGDTDSEDEKVLEITAG